MRAVREKLCQAGIYGVDKYACIAVCQRVC